MEMLHGFCVIYGQTLPRMTRGGFGVWLQLWFAVSHWVVQYHVLFGQLQQHRIVEELADTHILAQTLQSHKCGILVIKKNGN